MLSAARARDLVVVDVLLHLLLAPAIDRSFRLNAFLCHVVLDELVGTETLFTCLTVH